MTGMIVCSVFLLEPILAAHCANRKGWVGRHLGAGPVALALLLSPAAVLRRVLHGVQEQTCGPAGQIRSPATDLTQAGLWSTYKITEKPARAIRLYGHSRSANLFHHQKGQAYVQ